MSKALVAPDGAVEIAESVRGANSLPRDVFYSPNRGSSFVAAVRRMAAIRMYGAGYSTPEIGAALKRDHSSVVSMLQGGKGRTNWSAQ